MRYLVALVMLMVAASGVSATGKENFIKQQAAAELQRVSAQIDVLQTNQDDQADRLAKAEAKVAAMKSTVDALSAENAALRSQIESLKKEMSTQRSAIVDELSKKIAKMGTSTSSGSGAASGAKSAPAVDISECESYPVAPGDSLFLIARAFNTTVARIKELNGLKSDRISVGQTLLVPKYVKGK